MKLKTQKNYKKILKFYQLSFGFTEPYSVLLEPEFLKRSNEINIMYREAIPKTLEGKCKFYVTTCAVAECKRRGEDYKQILSMAKKLEYYKCDHVHDKEEVYLSRKCYADLAVNQPSTFYFAIQNNDSRFDLRHMPGVPLIFILTNKIILEKPSTASYRKTDQKHKLLTKTDDIDKILLLKAKFGDDYRPPKEIEKVHDHDNILKDKDDESDSDDDSGESESDSDSDVDSKDTTDKKEEKKKLKKKKEAGPNPLSVKRKQVHQPPKPRAPGSKKNRRKLRPASAIKQKAAKQAAKEASIAAKLAMKQRMHQYKQQQSVNSNSSIVVEAQ